MGGVATDGAAVAEEVSGRSSNGWRSGGGGGKLGDGGADKFIWAT